jgi:thymidine kinase
MCGKLELIIGPMFSGKSTELIRRIRLLQKIDKKVLVTKPLIDSRYYQNKITSHNYESVECMSLNRLDEISDETIQNYNCIVVDEGQFFPDLVPTISRWIDNFKIEIIVGGLDGDFQRQPLGTILNLIPYADKCQKFNSLCNICKDGTEAPFSFRLVSSSDKVLIGGSESYIPVCRNHFNKLTMEHNKLET